MKKLIAFNISINQNTVDFEKQLADITRLKNSGINALYINWYVPVRRIDKYGMIIMSEHPELLNEKDEYIDTDKAVEFIKYIKNNIEIPIIFHAKVPRFEDIKKILYAGVEYAYVDHKWHRDYPSDESKITASTIDLYKECHDRFDDKVIDSCLYFVCERVLTVDINIANQFEKIPKESPFYKDDIWNFSDDIDYDVKERKLVQVFNPWEKIKKNLIEFLDEDDSDIIRLEFRSDSFADLDEAIEGYKKLKEYIAVYTGESAETSGDVLEFSSFKTDEKGLVPCIAQDYKTGEVLMMAYMNEESYKKTLDTGLMTYWSRSRNKLWTKGEESGHFQHMISLIIDCDKDTILAKVRQEGPACHTGNPTCFFTPLVENDSEKNKNIMSVLEDVYSVIADRKVNPKEGSYTNYLFEKGIDKILKKVGEECTEIVIAAKNPDKEEIKYEIADFLYHVMVLMAERGVGWEEIADELARRE